MIGVYAAVLTYKPVTHDRLALLVETVNTLAREADAVFVVDNGSGPDELAVITEALGAEPFTHDGPLHTSGHGTNLQARILVGAAQPDDICVLSDDDMVWQRGWRKTLAAWWRNAPDRLVLTGCHLEADYPWNTIRGRVEFGGVPGLLRDSTGAASWSFRARDVASIFPIPERVQGTGDVPACKAILNRGLLIGQLDLAEHVGGSTWGNRTVEKFGCDVDPVRAMLEGDEL
jgi:GT2 family glycosyltransferase